MAWLRLDDGFDTHPKVLGLTEPQRWRWTRVLLYCARYRTRGRITPEALATVGVDSRFRARLISLELLHSTDNGSLLVNDWATYNPVDPTSASRKQRYRERHGNDSGTDEERDGNGERNGPHAQAGARVPSPTPEELPTAAARPLEDPGPAAAAETSDAYQRLQAAGWTPRQIDHTLQPDDIDRALAWLDHAENDPACRTPGALAWTQYETGGWPPTRPEPPLEQRLYADPSKVCDDCGETLGSGHLDDCPRLARPAEPTEQTTEPERLEPPPELAKLLSQRTSDQPDDDEPPLEQPT